MQDVRQSQLQVRQLHLDLLELLLDALKLPAERFARRQQGARVQALGFGLPHRLGVGIALGAQPISLYL